MRRRTILSVAVVLVAGLGAAAIYGMASRPGNSASECPADAAKLAALKPLAKGQLAALLVDDAPRPMPAITFQDAAGAPKSLADFKGKVVLMNMWATWCAPCRMEMPWLNELQTRLGGKDFEVVPVAIDLRDTDKPKRFMQEVGATALPFYADPTAKVFQTMKGVGRAVGLPTSLLIGRDGCEIGYMPGPAEWSSPDGIALIEAATK
jgi:thiol-disulfide isomerase/thioredoxin